MATTTRYEAGPFPARAKVNLYLHVTGRRADGYHELDSLLVRATLADRLWLSPAGEDRLELSGPFASALPEGAGDGELTMRALEAARAAAGVDARFHARLEKNIPVAAGLGGGSADAAAMLEAFCAMAAPGLDPARLAPSLGADVPACLWRRPAQASGAGERLRPAAPLPPCALVLVNPRTPLATAAVFARRRGGFGAPRPLAAPLRDAAALAAALAERSNDLEEAAIALAPETARVLAALRAEKGVLLARMSGSGATCFGLVETPAQARRIAARLGRRHPDWWRAAAAILRETGQGALPRQGSGR